MRITKSFVDKVEIPPLAADGKKTQSFYRDTSIPGFGLRVTSGGAKSFVVEKRVNGRVKRITLGRYGNLTVEEARKEAMKLLGKVAVGVDPVQEKQQAKVNRVTLKEAFDDYLQTRKDLKPSTVHDYNRSLNGAFKDWQQKAIIDITPDMVAKRHADYGKRSPARANNAMRVLRAVLNHARRKYSNGSGQPLLPINPVDAISHGRGWYKVERRQSLIKDYQIKPWYDATMQLNNLTTRDYLHLLILTGLRRSEASTLTWENVDFQERTLTVPETKNHRVHRLPLSDVLYDMLKRRSDERSSPYVFPSESERGYLTEPRTAVNRVAELSGVTFTLHDLRRTFITVAERLDTPGYALKRLLNHKDPNDVTEGYIIFDVERLRAPMQKITDFFMEHFTKEPADVVG